MVKKKLIYIISYMNPSNSSVSGLICLHVYCLNPAKTKNVEVFFYPIFPDFGKSSGFWKVPRFRSFALLATAGVYGDEESGLME
jgi:hypothetical protein